MLKKNMGTADRAVRLIVAALLLVAYFTMNLGGLGWLALLVAVIFFATSLVSSCPLYSIFGFSTCPMKKS